MWIWLAVLPGCDLLAHPVVIADDTGPAAVDTDADTDTDGDTDADTDTDTDADSDTDPTSNSGRCPSGMVPIPPVKPLYCFDAYEVTIDGILGSDDQYADNAAPPDATAEAIEGFIPTVSVTWSQVEAVCAATPAVDPKSGDTYGYKRLATSREWEDAGDGVIGEGGSRYPWGEEDDPSRCAVLGEAGVQRYWELQPTGSLRNCVSSFGVYDQVGNAWEWTDSEIAMSIDTWGRNALGVHIDGDVVRVDDEGVLTLMTVQVPTVVGQLAAGDDGRLEFLAESDSWDAGTREERGYLVLDPAGDPVANQLPIALKRASDDGVTAELTIRVATEADGRTFPDKRGSSYYQGMGVDLHHADYAQFYDIEGQITLRCSADPAP